MAAFFRANPEGLMTIYLKGGRFVPLAGGTMTGALTIASGTLTASSPALTITQTWNNPVVGFVGLDINITDTSSAGASYPLRIYRNGSNVLSLTKAGVLYVTTVAANLDVGASSDAFLFRDGSGQIGQRVGAAQQSFSVYNTESGSLANYERLRLTGVAGTSVNLTAESLGTGAANLDIVLTPAGTGVLKFGTHSALAAETVQGYITIKDSGGTTRKLAVVA